MARSTSAALRISDMNPASAPYPGGALFEVSVPAAGGGYDTRRTSLDDIAASLIASSGSASIHFGDTPPSNPANGALWWSSADGQLYIRYDDGSSAQWVSAVNQTVVIPPSTMVSKTGNYTILGSETGTRFNNSGAAADIVLTLPPSQPPMRYSFVVCTAHYIRINPAGLERIARGGNNSAAGGYVRSNLPFSALTLECHVAGQWVDVSGTGSWSIDL
jgi:hypothetical protein